jgi:hypothetical protein
MPAIAAKAHDDIVAGRERVGEPLVDGIVHAGIRLRRTGEHQFPAQARKLLGQPDPAADAIHRVVGRSPILYMVVNDHVASLGEDGLNGIVDVGGAVENRRHDAEDGDVHGRPLIGHIHRARLPTTENIGKIERQRLCSGGWSAVDR